MLRDSLSDELDPFYNLEDEDWKLEDYNANTEWNLPQEIFRNSENPSNTNNGNK